MNRWEYKVLSFQSTGMMRRKFDYAAMEEQLNRLGSEGWEIVEIKSIITDGRTDSMPVILKRPLK